MFDIQLRYYYFLIYFENDHLQREWKATIPQFPNMNRRPTTHLTASFRLKISSIGNSAGKAQMNPPNFTFSFCKQTLIVSAFFAVCIVGSGRRDVWTMRKRGNKQVSKPDAIFFLLLVQVRWDSGARWSSIRKTVR
jgi:hypothetical protein